MKKVISFDLDGTLVDARYGDMVWNHGIPAEYAKAYGMTFDDARRFIRNQYESVGDGDILWYEIRHWLKRFSLDVEADALLVRYESYISLMPDAAEVLRELHGRYTLVIASNAARIFVEKELAHTGVAGLFSHIVSATTDYGMIKKEEGFFLRLCADIGITSGEMVHVGDHPVFDHDVPSGLGIESYHINGHCSDARERRTISGLKDLLEVL
ncbi:MAG: HAD-superfamily hydrolase, subfamily variant 1 [Deltaproteobacteria bacterium]|nr:HAD-superfamily hydrolase, subfamily variant 1 [Deltaproteobacteria bacterium]